MANPYSIEPANPLQALMSGVGGFDAADKRAKEADMMAGRQEAAQALQTGGDLRGPLAKLLGIGDTKGAEAIAQFAHQQATEKQAGAALGESSRHNRALEGQSAAGLEEQKRLHERTLRLPVKIGADLSGDVYGIPDPASPGGFRRVDLKQLGGGQQPAGPAPFTGGVPFAGAGGQPSPAMPQQAPAAAGGASPAASGEAFLRTLPADMQPLIKGVANYEISPTTFSNRGQRERVLAAVKAYDPNFDETDYGNRFLTKKRFTSGPQGDTIRSMNVGIDHLATLDEYASALANGDIKIVNSIKNKFKDQFGYDAPVNFNAVKAIVGSEVSKAIIGSKGALQDREEIKAGLNNANSPEQLAGVVKAYKKLMAGQVNGLVQQYTGSGLPAKNLKLSPATKKELGLNDDNEPAAPAGASPAASGGGGVVDWKTYFGSGQ